MFNREPKPSTVFVSERWGRREMLIGAAAGAPGVMSFGVGAGAGAAATGATGAGVGAGVVVEATWRMEIAGSAAFGAWTTGAGAGAA